MAEMTKKQFMKQMEAQYNKSVLENKAESDAAELKNRAKSVTLGTNSGGISEIGMRRSDGTYTYVLLQPVEVVELVHQLAANAGCHLHIQPRKDFSSWREWNITEDESIHLNGHPPHSNPLSPYMQAGLTGYNHRQLDYQKKLEEQVKLGEEAKLTLQQQMEQDDAVAATKKINKRNTSKKTRAS
jgi:hypothetical protein